MNRPKTVGRKRTSLPPSPPPPPQPPTPSPQKKTHENRIKRERKNRKGEEKKICKRKKTLTFLGLWIKTSWREPHYHRFSTAFKTKYRPTTRRSTKLHPPLTTPIKPQTKPTKPLSDYFLSWLPPTQYHSFTFFLPPSNTNPDWQISVSSHQNNASDK